MYATTANNHGKFRIEILSGFWDTAVFVGVRDCVQGLRVQALGSCWLLKCHYYVIVKSFEEFATRTQICLLNYKQVTSDKTHRCSLIAVDVDLAVALNRDLIESGCLHCAGLATLIFWATLYIGDAACSPHWWRDACGHRPQSNDHASWYFHRLRLLRTFVCIVCRGA